MSLRNYIKNDLSVDKFYETKEDYFQNDPGYQNHHFYGGKHQIDTDLCVGHLSVKGNSTFHTYFIEDFVWSDKHGVPSGEATCHGVVADETLDTVIKIALAVEAVSYDDFDNFAADLGWEDWMYRFCDCEDDDSLTDLDCRKIDELFLNVFAESKKGENDED